MGVLSVFRDSVTLINRTNRVLNVRYDGEDITVQPGKNPGFPKEAMPFAKKQNPLRGSLHPINPMRFISLVGEEGVDDCTEIPEAVLTAADARLELVDRDGEFYGEPMRKVRLLKKTGFDPYEAQVTGSVMDLGGPKLD